MACRHGLNEDCIPCDELAEERGHLRKGDRGRCENVVVPTVDGFCAPCTTIRENAAEEASIARDTDRFFGGQS